MSEYKRPTVDGETVKSLAMVAKRINAIRDQNLRLVYLLRLCVENAQLLQEVNDHRMARGMEPLPVHDPKEMTK